MVLVFFQSCLSPHQIPYIRECATDKRVENVYFVMPRVDYDMRANMGWNSENLLSVPNVKFLLKPNDKEIENILSQNNNDIRCFFSGIRADVDIFQWFKISLHYDIKRYMITEPPFTYNKPLWMHYLRFFLQDYKYVRFFNGVFAIGESCARYYSSLSRHWRVYPFLYTTEGKVYENTDVEGDLKVLFVGSLSRRKNVKVLIEALQSLEDVELTIVGDGDERDHLEKLVAQLGVKTTFLGTQPITEIPFIMQKHDVLVLPSLHDGWGAVVNEALTSGLYAVCSDKCGAKDLLHDKHHGMVFENNDSGSLGKILKAIVKNKDDIRASRGARARWTKDHVGGKVVASYFISCLSEDNTVKCPWK